MNWTTCLVNKLQLAPIAHSCISSLGAGHQRVIYVESPIFPD